MFSGPLQNGSQRVMKCQAWWWSGGPFRTGIRKKQIEKQENKKGTHRLKNLGSVDLKGPSIKHPNDNLAVYIYIYIYYM